MSKRALGAHLWDDLPKWKKEALLVYGRFHDSARNIAKDMLDNYADGAPLARVKIEEVLRQRHNRASWEAIWEGMRRAEAAGFTYATEASDDSAESIAGAEDPGTCAA